MRLSNPQYDSKERSFVGLRLEVHVSNVLSVHGDIRSDKIPLPIPMGPCSIAN
jgi:hypothetical protein